MRKMEIGMYKIERLDEDYFLVTVDYGSGTKRTAKIAGGDLETVLGTIFTGAEITYHGSNYKTETVLKKTYFD